MLLQHLTPQQVKDLNELRCFYVFTADGKKYRVDRGWAGNVQLVDDKDKILESLCIHPSMRVPVPDNMLAQKLMLETDEAEFRRIANISRRAA